MCFRIVAVIVGIHLIKTFFYMVRDCTGVYSSFNAFNFNMDSFNRQISPFFSFFAVFPSFAKKCHILSLFKVMLRNRYGWIITGNRSSISIFIAFVFLSAA